MELCVLEVKGKERKIVKLKSRLGVGGKKSFFVFFYCSKFLNLFCYANTRTKQTKNLIQFVVACRQGTV